jgi:peptide deformylase
MFASMAAADGVGLAANQIGVDARVFVIDCPDAQGQEVIGYAVNPVLSLPEPVDGEPAEEVTEEGCLSVPGPYAVLGRPFSVTVAGQDLHGGPLSVTGTGFFARCLMHETEHLAGTLYIDHLNRRRRNRVLAEIEPFPWNGPLPEALPS